MLALFFLDFKKAFESVNQQRLFYKLRENKINGNFYNVLQSIYKQSQCALNRNNKLTRFFNNEKGVIQEILEAHYSSSVYI